MTIEDQNRAVFESIEKLIDTLNQNDGIVGLCRMRLILRKSKIPSLLLDDLGLFLRYSLSSAENREFTGIFPQVIWGEMDNRVIVDVWRGAISDQPRTGLDGCAAPVATNSTFPYIEEIRKVLCRIPPVTEEFAPSIVRKSGASFSPMMTNRLPNHRAIKWESKWNDYQTTAGLTRTILMGNTRAGRTFPSTFSSGYRNPSDAGSRSRPSNTISAVPSGIWTSSSRGHARFAGSSTRENRSAQSPR